MAENEERLLQPLTINYELFRKRFVAKKKKSWARPMLWIDAHEPSTVNRDDSEGVALTNIFEAARHEFRYNPLFTRDERLKETRLAADYAMARAMNIVKFLAFILVMSDEHSRRLLVLSGWRGSNVVENASDFHIHNRASLYDERTIKRYVAGLRKPCPGRPFNHSSCDKFVTADHGICWHCLQLYGQTRQEWPKWLLALVQDDDREMRSRAIEALYHGEFIEEQTIAA